MRAYFQFFYFELIVVYSFILFNLLILLYKIESFFIQLITFYKLSLPASHSLNKTCIKLGQLGLLIKNLIHYELKFLIASN
jgi:hypothetical protein